MRGSPSSRVRAVVAVEQVLAREGVQRILEGSAAVGLIASVGDREALVRVVEASAPDVVIIGSGTLWLDADGSLGIARMLDDRFPETGLLVLSKRPDVEAALALFRNGVAGRGYLLKARLADGDELLRAVFAVARGGAVVDPLVAEAVVVARMRAEVSPLRSLSGLEFSALAELATGKNNAAIAATLDVSRRTVEHRVAAVFAKLDLGDRADVDRRVQAALLFRDEHKQTDALLGGWTRDTREPMVGARDSRRARLRQASPR